MTTPIKNDTNKVKQFLIGRMTVNTVDLSACHNSAEANNGTYLGVEENNGRTHYVFAFQNYEDANNFSKQVGTGPTIDRVGAQTWVYIPII